MSVCGRRLAPRQPEVKWLLSKVAPSRLEAPRSVVPPTVQSSWKQLPMRAPCSRCGGQKRGTGQGYCPKPECRAAVATAKAEAKAAAAKAKAAVKPNAAVKPKAMPMKRPAAGASDAVVSQGESQDHGGVRCAQATSKCLVA